MTTFRRSPGDLYRLDTKALVPLLLLLPMIAAIAGGSGCAGVVSGNPQIPAALSITVLSLPAATSQTAYSVALSASGGNGSYSWSMASGSLPPGLAISAAGQISGTPTQAGSFSFAVKVTDSSSPAQSATANLSIAVAAAGVTPVQITTSSLAGGQAGTAYSATLAASGGTTPYSWSIASGSLPAVLTLSSGGVISGTPTAGGTSSFTVRVTDSSSSPKTATMSLSLVIAAANSPALTVAPSSVSFGKVVVGSTNSQTLQVSNSGTAALTIAQVGASGSGFSTGAIALPLSLNPGKSNTFNVQFSPASAGAVTGSVSILSDAPNSPAAVALSGNGVAATLTLSISPASLTFGNVNVGGSSSQNVTITNTGNANVNVSQIGVSGTGFSLNGAATPVSLTPTQTMTFSVIFSPTVSGPSSGTVTVNSNATGSPASIALSGMGVVQVQHSVALNWIASATPTASGYNVYRSAVSGNGYVKLNSSPLGSLSYTDSTVQNTQTYFYVATAVDANGDESIYSNEIQMNIP